MTIFEGRLLDALKISVSSAGTHHTVPVNKFAIVYIQEAKTNGAGTVNIGGFSLAQVGGSDRQISPAPHQGGDVGQTMPIVLAAGDTISTTGAASLKAVLLIYEDPNL